MFLLWVMFVFEHEADLGRPRYVNRLAERPRPIAGGSGGGRVDTPAFARAQAQVVLEEAAKIRDDLDGTGDTVGARRIRGCAEVQPLGSQRERAARTGRLGGRRAPARRRRGAVVAERETAVAPEHARLDDLPRPDIPPPHA